MDVTPLLPPGKQIIDAYGDAGFRVAEQRYDGSVLVFADKTEQWSVQSWDAVTADDFTALFASEPQPEMVVIGCGERFQMLTRALKQPFRDRGIAVEAMDTGAACRTYNILLAEGRRVAAALIAV